MSDSVNARIERAVNDTRKSMALGYLWGLEDGNYKEVQGVDKIAFADWYARKTHEEVGSLNSALKQWKSGDR